MTTNTLIITDAQEASTQWHGLIDGCFLDEIYDQSERCLDCGVKYYYHDDYHNHDDDHDDYQNACEEFEAEIGDYFDRDRLNDGLDAELIELYEATKHIPFSDLPKQNMTWLAVAEFVALMNNATNLDEVWIWLNGWNTHK